LTGSHARFLEQIGPRRVDDGHVVFLVALWILKSASNGWEKGYRSYLRLSSLSLVAHTPRPAEEVECPIPALA